MMNQPSSISSIIPLDKAGNNYVYSDEQLMARFQKGDENAYVELVNRYRDRLLNFVYNYIDDFEISEDIVQDTMVKLYQIEFLDQCLAGQQEYHKAYHLY